MEEMFNKRMGDCPNCGTHFPIETLRTREMTAEEKGVMEEITKRNKKKETDEFFLNLIAGLISRREEFGFPSASKEERERILEETATILNKKDLLSLSEGGV